MMRKKKLLLFAGLLGAVLLLASVAITQNWQRQNEKTEEEHMNSGGIMDEEIVNGVVINDHAWQEMEKLVNVYYGEAKDQVNYSGKMVLTDDSDGEGKILEEQVFEYSVYKSDFYYKIAGYECVSKENFLMLVDHQQKSVSVSGVRPGTGTKDQALDIAAYSELMQQQNAQVQLIQTSTGRILKIDKIQDPSIQGFSIHYDPATYRISKIVIGMLRFTPLQETTETATTEVTTDGDDNDNGEPTLQAYLYKLTIDYEKTGVVPGATTFTPENKFIRIKDNKIELASGYEQYELMD